jgi:fimbrial chaperone protein
MRPLLVLFLTFVLAATGFAQGLVVAPTRIVLEPNQRTTEAGVTNRTNRPVRYRLSVEDVLMDARGVTREISGTFPYSVKGMVRFMPKTLTLAPGQRQTVRIMVNRPVGLEAGDYHSHFMLNEIITPVASSPTTAPNPEVQNSGFGLEIGMSYSTGVPLIVQVGQISSSLRLNGATLVREAGRATALELNLTRSGNAEGAALLQGTTAGGAPAFAPRMVRLYREVENATVRQVINETAQAAVAQGGVKLLWLSPTDRKTVLQTLQVNP